MLVNLIIFLADTMFISKELFFSALQVIGVKALVNSFENRFDYRRICDNYKSYAPECVTFFSSNNSQIALNKEKDILKSSALMLIS